MEWALVPVSMFLKNFSYTLPTTLSTIPFFLMVIFLLFSIYSTPAGLEKIQIDTKVLITTLVVMLSQLVMYLYSYQITNRPHDTSGLVTGPINLVCYIANIYIVFYLMQLTMQDSKKIRNFVKATMITYTVFALFVLLPQVYATSHWGLDHYVNFIGKTFEATHKGRDDFYQFGSYTTTLRRVNGFSQEASFLAAQIGIVFLPFILAAIKNKFDYFSDNFSYLSKAYYWLLLLITFVTLFFAKTSTGFVVIAVAIVVFIFSLPRKERWFYYKVIGLVLCLLLILYLFDPAINNILDRYIFKKQGTSNRLGGTLALFTTFIHYPITGVGRGYTSFFNFKYVPSGLTQNKEFYQVFQKTGFSNQSMWGEVFAGYGLIAIVPVFTYIYHKVKAAKRLKKVLSQNSTITNRLYATVIDSFYYSLCIFSIVMLFSLSWTDNIYLVIFFFYIVIINRLNKEFLG